jgi:hypothetical protein
VTQDTVEDIVYRHFPVWEAANAGRFAAGTTGHDVKSMMRRLSGTSGGQRKRDQGGGRSRGRQDSAVRGAISQGASREEARDNVIDALGELLAVRFGSPPELTDPADSDLLELTIVA